MMKFSIKNWFSLISILTIIAIATIFMVQKIEIETGINALLPKNENLERSIALTTHSSISNKVLIYLEAKTPEILDDMIQALSPSLTNAEFLTLGIPTNEDIQEIRDFVQKNALFLYPYTEENNPFAPSAIETRLHNKYESLIANPFDDLSEAFFSDPLNLSLDVLKLQFSGASHLLSVHKGGVLSENKKSWLGIYAADFYPEDYEKNNLLLELNSIITQEAEAKGGKGFLFSAHLYFNESSSTIKKEVSILSIFAVALTLLVFIIFFRSIYLLALSFFPILLGFLITFATATILFQRYGAISIAFGATSAGICIDYTIHYLSRLENYASLRELRKGIGFSMILSWLTTTTSFLILTISKIRSLVEIAYFGASMLSVTLISVWFIIPLFIRPENTKLVMNYFPFNDIRLKLSRSFILIPLILIILFAAISTVFVRLEDNPYTLDMKHKKLDAQAALILEHFRQSTDNVFLAFQGKDENDAMEQSINALYALYEKDPDLTFLNPALFSVPNSLMQKRIDFISSHFNKEVFQKKLEQSEFTENAFASFINQIETISSTSKLPQAPDYLLTMQKEMLVPFNNHYYSLVHVGDRNKIKVMKEILDDAHIDALMIDVLEDSKKGLLTFESKALKLVFLAFFVMLIILTSTMRNVINAIIAMLPPFLGVIAGLSSVVISGAKLNIMHCTALILITGIGVDYGIYVTIAWLKKLSDKEKNITLQSIITSALTTLAGFSVLSFSSARSLQSLGIFMTIGVITALLTACIIVSFIHEKRQAQ